ncbi:MAG: sulfurtransferase [Ilumatobacteraceae bacterium]|nr:sulfurtransferase [Ilumatobacteraceae bacterium]
MEMTTVAELVARARQTIDNLAPADFAARIGPDALLVDIREPDEVATGAIPGAIAVPRGMIEFRADPGSPYHLAEFDPARPVLVYCASGGRSALAGAALRQLGYTDVAHLDGGVTAWRSSGRSLA